MAQLDANIFLQQQAPDLSQIGAGFERGMRIGDLMRENKIKQAEMQKQNTIKEAYNYGYETGPDGKTVLNPMKVKEFMLGKGLAQNAFKFDQDFQEQQVASLENQNKLRGAVFEQTYGDVDFAFKNPGTPQAQQAWERAYDKAERLGYPMAGLSRTYDPGLVSTVYNSMLPLSKQREFEIQKQQNEARLKQLEFDRQIQMGRLGLDEKKIQNEISKGEGLPLDKKKIVETLSTKVANVSSIKNELDTFVSMWPKLSETERLKQGDLLLKTLNSPQGADAIGVEEANRLGNKLKFAYGNFTNDNPTQFGRDLEGFFNDVKNTSLRLGGTIQKNQDQIDESMGRAGPVKIKKEDMPPNSPKVGSEQDGYIFIGGDPADQKSWRKK